MRTHVKMTHFNTLVKALTLTVAWFSMTSTFATSKTEALQYLNSLKAQNRTQLNKVSESIQERLQKATQYQSLKGETHHQPSPYQKVKIQNNESFLDKMISQRQELLLRQNFLDQLSFRFDSYYKGKNIKNFLHQQLTQMAEVQAFSPSPSQQNTWKFLSYLAIAIKEYPERNEDILAFAEGYMKFSKISNPLRPDQYFSSRHYSNGTTTETATPIHREDIGNLTENRLNELDEGSSKTTVTPRVITPTTLHDSPKIQFDEPKDISEFSDEFNSQDLDDKKKKSQAPIGLHQYIHKEHPPQHQIQRDPASLPSKFKLKSVWSQ